MRILLNTAAVTKLMVVFLFILSSAIASASVSWRSLNSIEETNSWRDHTYQVLQQVELLVTSMVNQETGVRGYLVSADENFLDPYRAGTKIYGEALARARELVSDNPAQLRRLSDLDQSAHKWRDDVAQREITLMLDEATRAQARQIEASGAGKGAMDALRAKATEISQIEIELLDERARAAETAAFHSRMSVLICVAAMLFIACSGVLLLIWTVSRPMRTMTNLMRRLADGDIGTAVPFQDRREEIGAMACAVQVFKDNLIRTLELEDETRQARFAAEEQRKAGMRQMADGFEAAVGGLSARCRAPRKPCMRRLRA